jgi:tetratricopeptide (TPR) repeat protein
LQDPGNLIYAQTFLFNLKKKFGEKKKTTRSFIAAGKTLTIVSKKPESLFKVGIETLKSNPWDIETLISTGKACEDLGYLETAIVYYRAAVDADPDHVGANLACSAALKENADFPGALACLQRILKKHPENVDVQKLRHDLLAEQTIHKGKYAMGASRDEVEFIGTAIPKDEDVMGRILTEEEQLERRITKNPLDTANYIELALWYSKHSDFAKAESVYARAVNVSQNAPDMVERLLEIQKRRLHAESLRMKAEYESALQEDVKSVFLETRRQYEAKSMELAQHRVKHYPTHTGYRYDYGILLQKNEQVKEAIAELQLAKAEPSRQGDCLLALGQCFQMIRQYKLAMTHYQEAVSALEPGESKKKALYLAMKLAFTLEDYGLAESYGHQLAAIDFSYRDLGDVLEQIARQHSTKNR